MNTAETQQPHSAVSLQPRVIPERPILFTGEMVRAILNGEKTQTRRVIKPQPIIKIKNDYICDYEIKKGKRYAAGINVKISELADNFKGIATFCPYGKIGDRLWVRETWADVRGMGIETATGKPLEVVFYADDPWAQEAKEWGIKWKPSIHMPKKYSRINLKITNIRVERIQTITDNDAQCEGVNGWNQIVRIDNITAFAELWDSINAKRGFGWNTNPWVWVIELEKV